VSRNDASPYVVRVSSSGGSVTVSYQP
jgi:hypothetical protein